MRILLSIYFFLFSVGMAAAQNPINLIADQIIITPNGALIAKGNVVIWQKNTKIKAHEVSYNDGTGELTLIGQIIIQNGSSEVIFADQATLSNDLQTGIIASAKIILSQQVQIVASQVSQSNGRYTKAKNIAATSCQVCLKKTPLWQIRAKSIVHDKVEKQLYFDQAQLRLLNIPILLIPQLRLPDPSLKRATGFLVPLYKNSSRLKSGLKTPYFISLSDHKDLTMTPFYSPKTRTLEFEYRQAYQSGLLNFKGAVSNDSLLPDTGRGYIFGTGSFDLGRHFKLGVQVQAVRDKTYLFDYDYAELDRLNSNIDLTRANREETIEMRLSSFNSLRSSDDNSTEPTIVAEMVQQFRYFPNLIGGESGLKASALGSYRYSDANTDFDGDREVDGYDTLRLSLDTDWQRNWTFQNGFIFDLDTELSLSYYNIQQHVSAKSDILVNSSAASAGLRWPLIRKNNGGSTAILEPHIQFASVSINGSNVPNQDSTRVEFDEGNLFKFNRAPGYDLTENGFRINIGLKGESYDVNGGQIGWKIGKVMRAKDTSFSYSSGLSGKSSDWLIATNIDHVSGIELIGRAMITDEGRLGKTETRLNWRDLRNNISAQYAWLAKDTDEEREKSLSGLSLGWQSDITQNWTTETAVKFDTSRGEATDLDFGLKFSNECLNIGFSASRRFSTSSTLQPSTDYNFKVELTGFSTGLENPPKQKRCRSI